MIKFIKSKKYKCNSCNNDSEYKITIDNGTHKINIRLCENCKIDLLDLLLPF